MFEPFGTLKAVVNAARDGSGSGTAVSTDNHGSGDPTWEAPLVEDLEVN